MARSSAAAAVIAGSVFGLLAVPLPAASSPTPTPSPTFTAPLARPNPASPFDGFVGGEQLGRHGIVVDPGTKPGLPAVAVESFVVADLDTGEILAAKNAHSRMKPASTLKMLTAVTLLPRLDKRATYVATRQDANIEGSRVGLLAGAKYTVDQLFYGLFLPSGNDAANALANAAGGVPAAVRMMNLEAARLGAFDTFAVNPSGLDEPAQWSSAYDLALIARAGLQRIDFRRYCSVQRLQFPGKPGTTFQIQNGNKLLTEYPGAFGVKNGFTTLARNTLVGVAERNGRRILVTVMRTPRPSWEKVAALFDWGFAAVASDSAVPVGRLVTADDVTRAIASRAATRSRSPSGSPSASSISPSGTPGVDAAASPDPNQQPGIDLTTQLGRVPLWIWAAGLMFVVLTSLRVRTYLRTKRRKE
jgi:serine-type D-Ala-D-Ala carboxypeptidase (penicillin-binding protein 5/6)